MIGMAILGCLFYGLMLTMGHYHVQGVGYSTIQAVLDSKLTIGVILLLLFVAKLLATSVTIGSGASGGIFSPALFLGATLGGAFGAFYGIEFPAQASAIPTFAMVGMAAMVGSATGAAMTAVVMIFEMTRDYNIVLPMILAVAMAQGIRRMLSVDNIYTLKLTRRGIHIPMTLHSNMFLVKKARDVMETTVFLCPSDVSVADLAEKPIDQLQVTDMVVLTRGQQPVGLVQAAKAQEFMTAGGSVDMPLRLLANHDFTIARESDVMFDVLKRMSRKGKPIALVFSGDRLIPRASDITGYITNDDIAQSVAESLAFRIKHR